MTISFIDEFRDDFLQEAEEHLAKIADLLLALEGEAESGERGEQIDSLFRSYHTMKGLCGMVQLDAAADLAHAMESILRDIKKGRGDITSETIDLLLGGRQALAAEIEHFQNPDSPQPDPASVLSALIAYRGAELPDRKGLMGVENSPALETQAPWHAEVLEARPEPRRSETGASRTSAPAFPPEVESALNDHDRQLIAEALQRGESLSLAIFTPGEEKAAGGIDVNAVREQLGAVARLLKAFPIIEENQVRFGFLLANVEPIDPESLPELEWPPLNAVRAEPAPTDARPPRARPESPAEEAGKGPRGVVTTSVRVDIERLDEIMRLVGFLVLSRSRLAASLPSLQNLPTETTQKLEDISDDLERQIRYLREAVMRARMVPLVEVFARMPLAVRDLARSSGKQVDLVTEGQEHEIDKALVERLLDPLLHLVRNAVSHGIESPEARQAVGKLPKGRLTLRGQPEGDHILIQISDDGRGLDLETVAAKAARQGLIPAGAAIDAEEALDLICRPGFSTKQSADMGSGRGVGMDVVRRAVTSLGGSLSLETSPGQGSTFTLQLPLTLTIIDVFLAECGPETYAIPRGAVQQVVEIDPAEIVTFEGGDLIPYRGRSLPLLYLGELFAIPSKGDGSRVGLVVGRDGGEAILVVDRVPGLNEVVVRAIHDPLIARPGISGASELGDGRVVLILNIPDLLRFARNATLTPNP